MTGTNQILTTFTLSLFWPERWVGRLGTMKQDFRSGWQFGLLLLSLSVLPPSAAFVTRKVATCKFKKKPAASAYYRIHMFRGLGSLGKYVIAFCMGLLCAMPCLWAPAAFAYYHICTYFQECGELGKVFDSVLHGSPMRHALSLGPSLPDWQLLLEKEAYKGTSVQETWPGIGASRD